MNVSNKEMFFCGENRKFKSCPNKILKTANDKIAEIQKSVGKEQEKVTTLEREYKELEIEADSLKQKEAKYLETNDEKFALTEEDNKNVDELIKKIDKKKKDFEKAVDKFEKFVKSIEVEIQDAYDEKCNKLLTPFKKGEFQEKSDNIDGSIVPFLEVFYDMYMSGFPLAKIEHQKREILEQGHKVKFNQLFQN